MSGVFLFLVLILSLLCFRLDSCGSETSLVIFTISWCFGGVFSGVLWRSDLVMENEEEVENKKEDLVKLEWNCE